VSFRLRIFLLVMLTTVVAIGATAWLTLSLTARELDRSQHTADQASADIATTITTYGLSHGEWSGIDRVTEQLSRQNNLHIQVKTEFGVTLADSDTIRGLRAGPVQPAPRLVDARPHLDPAIAAAADNAYSDVPAVKLFLGEKPIYPTDLFGPAPTDLVPASPLTLILRQLGEYRAALATMRCASAPPAGLPLVDQPYLTAAFAGAHRDCVTKATRTVLADHAWMDNAWSALVGCLAGGRGTGQLAACLDTEFLKQVTAATSIDQLQIYLGAPGGTDLRELRRPAFFGAAGLLLVALAGTALIARRISKPVARLTEASRQLAEGRHDVRVPSVGRGELARLSASFNTMAEAVQRSEERQRRLVADVAHEMRTPLSNLRGYLEGLSDGVVEPSRELFASLHEETLLQRRILDDLQVLAAAEAGELTYDRRTTDLAELAALGATAQRAVAVEARVALTVDVPAPVWVDADADRVRQVVGNLLSNAIRYTDAGGHVLVRVRAVGGSAVLTVQDTGVGMTPDDQRRVFDRFWRADPARQRATGGSGLGLTIAHRIVTDHGGRIEVASRPGAGTTFTVVLPLVSGDVGPIGPAAPASGPDLHGSWRQPR
jgi:two-component system sensor histidine kinase BaeS